MCLAALHLARDDAAAASRTLQECRRKTSGHAAHRAATLAMLVEACLARGARAATAELRTALAAWTRLRQPFEAARTRAALGVVLADTGDPGASDCLRWALKDLVGLGARSEADRVARTLRSTHAPPRAGRVTAGPARPDGLSAREEQVLRLVAAGLSNPEIAARLCVSRKTVAHHVSHVPTKLNLRNRTQIAAYAAAYLVDLPSPRPPE